MKMDKEYNPLEFESRIYQEWEEAGCFRATVDSSKKPYTIVIPPPNRTGVLHMGHALNNTLQDILIRFKRMQGFNACWVPGTDHAGIATQNVVEKRLKQEEGLTRHDLGRETFVERVRQFAEDHGDIIIGQLKRVGCSCDWDRIRYTLDPGLSQAVRKVFVHLYKKGLIYRGTAIVNMCPVHGSLSDEEVEYKEVKGKLWHIRYPITGTDEFLVVATTRPETMLGDVAVAVHPEDDRYKHLVGKTVTLPLMNREIPVIADSFVDPEFGTGCVKITPSHDPNDFEAGKRNHLQGIIVMTPSAVMNENAGPYEGMDRFAARKQIVADLESQGLLEKIDEHLHKVGHSYRSGEVIEPYESEQWFVAMKTLAAPGIEAAKEGEVRFHPERYTKIYLDWLENIHDWCISRQLWWGHRIPVWYCEDCGAMDAHEEDPTACSACGSGNIRQEEDVLDTWFSSWLWPFTVFGWPEITDDLKTFYPTDVLVTGPDIIFFWVARMIMAGLEFVNDIPFHTVILTGIVRDEHMRKMSKSLGNSIDPIKVMDGKFKEIFGEKAEVAERPFGADALRISFPLISIQGQDIALSYEKLETGGNFINKLWNASRFILSNLDNEKRPKLVVDGLPIYHRWILSRVNSLTQQTTQSLEGHRFHECSTNLYNFVWFEFCDWYIELLKPSLRGDEGEQAKEQSLAVALEVLDRILRLLHPIIPFVTEEIWGKVPGSKGHLMLATWPDVQESWEFEAEVEILVAFQDIVRAARNMRAEVNLKPSVKVPLIIACPEDDIRSGLETLEPYIAKLAHLSEVSVFETSNKPKFCATGIVGHTELYMPLEGLVDVDAELERLDGQLKKCDKEIAFFEKKLSNEKYIRNAPAEVVAKDSEKLSENKRKHEKLEDARRRIISLKE